MFSNFCFVNCFDIVSVHIGAECTQQKDGVIVYKYRRVERETTNYELSFIRHTICYIVTYFQEVVTHFV